MRRAVVAPANVPDCTVLAATLDTIGVPVWSRPTTSCSTCAWT